MRRIILTLNDGTQIRGPGSALVMGLTRRRIRLDHWAVGMSTIDEKTVVSIEEDNCFWQNTCLVLAFCVFLLVCYCLHLMRLVDWR